MRMRRHPRAPWVVLALVVLSGWLPARLELIVRDCDSGESLLILPLSAGERFVLHYIHSVDRAPIWEVHSVDRAARIYLEEERFAIFGAGMGHWSGHGNLTTRDRWQVIERIHAPIGHFLLRVGSPGVAHTIIWREQDFNLSAESAGRLVEISARWVSFWQRVWARRGLADA